MLAKLKNHLRERRIQKLADAAQKLAADEYESQEFGWTQNHEFKDGDAYASATRPGSQDTIRIDGTADVFNQYDQRVSLPAAEVFSKATSGCLLGGIARAAWKVTGEPEFGTPAWDLREAVEIEVERRVIRQLVLEDTGYDLTDPDQAEAFASRMEAEMAAAKRGGGIIPDVNDSRLAGYREAVLVLREAK